MARVAKAMKKDLVEAKKACVGKKMKGFKFVDKIHDSYNPRMDLCINHVGEYKFDASKLKEAHEWCRKEAESCMKPHGFDRVIVSNTFTQEWEMDAYYNLAKKYGYRVHSIIVENRHGGINEHGVPADKLEQMKNRFEIKL